MKLDTELHWTFNIWMGVSVENDRFKYRIDDLRNTGAHIKFLSLEPLLGPLENLNLEGIDWVIVGGESGPYARPMKAEWVTEIRDQCLESNTFRFSSNNGAAFSKRKMADHLDGRTWDELPNQISNLI